MKIGEKVNQKTVDHPLEDMLNIEPSSTVMTTVERVTELDPSNKYDDKDVEIEESYQEILDKAMDGYNLLQDEIDSAEVKYIPRLAEVSATMLRVALDAAKEKGGLKAHKDKLEHSKRGGGPSIVNNTQNNIVMNREELMKAMRQEGNSSIIEAEVVVVKNTTIEETKNNDDN